MTSIRAAAESAGADSAGVNGPRGTMSNSFGCGDRSRSTNNWNASLSCCWAVRRTLVRIACARAPFWVRLPPQFFRITTNRRITRSAKLLVASTKPGQYKKVNKYGRSWRKCLANRRFAGSRYLRSSKRSSLASSRPVAVHNPCSEIFCSR